jgi:hypothetical protein
VFALLLGIALPALADKPDLKTGDLVFQTSTSSQSKAILWATKSKYSHVGIVWRHADKLDVLEAVQPVKVTPMKAWVARGLLGRYTVLRYPQLTDAQAKTIVAEARRYLGRNYDLFFVPGNPEIYCSELVWLAFKAAGIEIGREQRSADLDMDNLLVRKLVAKRWQRHPLCKGRVKSAAACLAVLQTEQTLVTPESQADDTKLVTVFSNYP